MTYGDKIGPEEDEAADVLETEVPEDDLRDDEDFGDGCLGDEDSGALGFGGYGERGDDDPRDYIEPEDPWGIDGMGPDGE